MTNELEKLIEKISVLLKDKGLSVAIAESCTGGGLCYEMTRLPGSSRWLDRGFITYSNQAKVDLLGVTPSTLLQFGAVSAETAREMASGAILKSNAQIGIATTGIAGPGGGSPEKPVGTVFIAFAMQTGKTALLTKTFKGDRNTVRQLTITSALEHLWHFIR